MSVEDAVAVGKGHWRGELYHWDGKLLTISEIAKLTCVPDSTIRSRMRKGYTLEQAAQRIIDADDADAAPAKPISIVAETNDNSSPAEKHCLYIAKRIVLQVFCGDISDYNLRCAVPLTEYIANSEILELHITFDKTWSTARLTAKYLENNAPSSLNRLYTISGDGLKEVVNTKPDYILEGKYHD